MNTFDDLQSEVLKLPMAERGRMAIAVLDSLDDEPTDELVAEAWASEVLARSASYARRELTAKDWRQALEMKQESVDDHKAQVEL